MDGQEEKRQTTKKDKRDKKTTRGELNLVRLGFNEGKVLSSLEKLCRQQSICHPRTPKFFIWLSMHFENNINELNLAAQPPYIWKLNNLYALSIYICSVSLGKSNQFNEHYLLLQRSVLWFSICEIQGHFPLSFAPGRQETPVLTNNRTRERGIILRFVISLLSSPIPQKSAKCPEKHP